MSRYTVAALGTRSESAFPFDAALRAEKNPTMKRRSRGARTTLAYVLVSLFSAGDSRRQSYQRPPLRSTRFANPFSFEISPD